MDAKTFQKDGVNVFEVAGEININTSPELRKLFERESLKRVVVDLQKVSYIDSSGLATLVEVLKRVKAQGGLLGLSGMSDKVRSLFEITKLDQFFLIAETREEAVDKVKQPS
ncbi:MAG: STAS domain-containing protein [Candidatus Omnitrophica bacterium]|nr:STAS domain-containing protein [Candidatus Omnitrophota bacterium]